MAHFGTRLQSVFADGTWARTTVAATAVLTLAACSSAIPRLPQDDGKTAQAILHAVQCELSASVGSNELKNTLAKWGMRVRLELKDNGALGATPTVTPISSNASVIPGPIPVGASANNARRSIIEFDAAAASYAPSKAPAGTPADDLAASCSGKDWGSLGLKDWLLQSLSPVSRGPGSLKDLQFYADFTVQRSVGGAITLKTPIAELKLDKPSASLGTEDHLQIIFAKLPSAITTFGLTDDGMADLTEALDARQAELDKENEPVIQLRPGDSLVVQ